MRLWCKIMYKCKSICLNLSGIFNGYRGKVMLGYISNVLSNVLSKYSFTGKARDLLYACCVYLQCYLSFPVSLYAGSLCVSSSVYVTVVLLMLGVMLLTVTGSMRTIFGLLLIGVSINVYLFSVGYLLIPLLLLIGIVVICIILLMIKYNNYNVYNNNNNNSSVSSVLLLFVLYVLYVCCSSNSSSASLPIPGLVGSLICCKANASSINEMLGFVMMYESNLLVHLLVLVMYILISLIILLSSNLQVLYQLSYSSSSNPSRPGALLFSIVNYLYLNVFMYIIIAVLICYIPIVIRYRTKIYKWNSDIYEVGVGVNLSSSMYNVISNNSIGNNIIYYYLYLFLLLDIFVTLLLIYYFVVVNVYLLLLLLLLMLSSLTFTIYAY